MKHNNQSTVKNRYKYLFILPVLLALLLNINAANAQQPKDNKQADAKPIKLTPKQLAVFAGKYRYMDTYVTVTQANGGLVMKQLQGERATISFYPTDLYEFHTTHFGKPYWIRFSGNGKSKAPSFVTMDFDIWKRVN